ncbi:Hypothetical predicted protein, partial [Olea europaea subsp. europaea]
ELSNNISLRRHRSLICPVRCRQHSHSHNIQQLHHCQIISLQQHQMWYILNM